MTDILILVIASISIALLTFGLVQSKKHNFTAGFYAFLILIVNNIYTYIAPLITHSLIDSYLLSNTEPPLGISILIFGLNRMWNSKTTSKTGC